MISRKKSLVGAGLVTALALSVSGCGGGSGEDNTATTPTGQTTTQALKVNQGEAEQKTPTTSAPAKADGPKDGVIDSRKDLPAAAADATPEQRLDIDFAADLAWAKCMKEQGFDAKATRKTVSFPRDFYSRLTFIGIESAAENASTIKEAEEVVSLSKDREAPAGVDEKVWRKASTGFTDKTTIKNLSPARLNSGCNAAARKVLKEIDAAAQGKQTLFSTKYKGYIKGLSKDPEIVALKKETTDCLTSKGQEVSDSPRQTTVKVKPPTEAEITGVDAVQVAKDRAARTAFELECHSQTNALERFYGVIAKKQTELLADPKVKADLDASAKAHQDAHAVAKQKIAELSK